MAMRMRCFTIPFLTAAVILIHIILLLLVLIEECQSETPKATAPSNPGAWGKWGPWQECSKTCGIGIRRRTRTCSYTGNKSYLRCKGKMGQMKNCDTKVTCPIHGGWSEWTAWQCTVTCGGGEGTQRRSCTNPKPTFGGKECNGTAEESGKCNTQKCPDQIFTLSPMTAQAVKNSIDKEHYNLQKKQDETVKIPCSPSTVTKIYEEYPKASLMWTKNGQILKIDHDRMTLTPAELAIEKLGSFDSGVYVCSVNYAPLSAKPVTVAAVAVESRAPDIKIPAEESMKLVCHGAQLAKIFKNATQRWLINETTVFEDFGAGASPVEKNLYQVEVVKKNMTGKWSCRIRDPVTNREWTTNVVVVKVLPAIPRILRFLSNRNVHLTFGIVLLLLVMLMGTVFGYVITKTREEFMADFDKWTQVVKWEEIKAGGVPKWAKVKEIEEVDGGPTEESSDETQAFL